MQHLIGQPVSACQRNGSVQRLLRKAYGFQLANMLCHIHRPTAFSLLVYLIYRKKHKQESVKIGLRNCKKSRHSDEIDRSTIVRPLRMAYSIVYRVPPAEPSKAAISNEAWSTI